MASLVPHLASPSEMAETVGGPEAEPKVDRVATHGSVHGEGVSDAREGEEGDGEHVEGTWGERSWVLYEGARDARDVSAMGMEMERGSSQALSRLRRPTSA